MGIRPIKPSNSTSNLGASNTSTIIGVCVGVIGGVLIMAAIAIVIAIYMKKKKEK